ncbi:P-loop NTPase fold protein [Gardnerella sp. Marseille-Q2328]|uniref:KAP family P-loop NTPase fold protein n=1 Tax=Gardnerella sp. Marseille-Q2328 TaxID=2759694 RepID=UPI00202505A5|nr:P-loop NTPase fold protein [Gardnerella sp. Marseille-Q2328]
MSYDKDKPIVVCSEDLLDRQCFSQEFGKALYEYNGADGLVVGLYGKWGSGKTSVLNMAKEEIYNIIDKKEKKVISNSFKEFLSKLFQFMHKHNKTEIIEFSPWNYSDKNNLISLFFQSLKYKLCRKNSSSIGKNIKKALKKYIYAIRALEIVPTVGPALAPVLKTIVKVLQSPDLNEAKRKLSEQLREYDGKIIVFIDDIDRLTAPQIRDIFQLVKQVGDLPNIIYVLAMDREIVCNALSKFHNIDGNEYLEKIVQVAFEIPELNKSKLCAIFHEKLCNVVDALPDHVIRDENYWEKVFEDCVSPYITNLRDVIRLINTFQFRYGVLYRYVSFEDMLCITALEVFDPQLYKWICNNKGAIYAHGIDLSLLTNTKKEHYFNQYYDEFESLGVNPDLAMRIISTIFPRFAVCVNVNKNDFDINVENIYDKRVACENNFELYFMFNFEDVNVSERIINDYIFKLNGDELNTFIEIIKKRGYIAKFLDTIKLSIDKIPYNRLVLMAFSMLVYGKNLYAMSSNIESKRVITSILRKLKTDEERFEIINSALSSILADVASAEKKRYPGLSEIAVLGMDVYLTISNSHLALSNAPSVSANADFAVSCIDETRLGMIAKIIDDLESNEDLSKSLTKNNNNPNYLERLELTYALTIECLSRYKNILEMEEFRRALCLWKRAKRKEADDYVNNLLKDKVNKLKFICAMSESSDDQGRKYWAFPAKNYSEYISEDEVFNAIRDFNKKELDKFTKIEQVKLAAFVLLHNNHNVQYISDQEATELVYDWKYWK